MNRLRLLVLVPAAGVALATSPAVAGAQGVEIFRDCADGRIDGTYTPTELRQARQSIPTDVDEYTDCRDVLTAALEQAFRDATGGDNESGGDGGGGGDGASGDGGSGGSGGDSGAAGGDPAARTAGGELLAPATPAEQRALNAAREGSGAVRVGDETIVPGAAGLAAGAARQDLPLPLVLVLVLSAALVTARTVPGVRRLVFRGSRRS